MNRRFIRKLRGIAGTDHVSTAPEDLICYSYDGALGTALPDAIVHPVVGCGGRVPGRRGC